MNEQNMASYSRNLVGVKHRANQLKHVLDSRRERIKTGQSPAWLEEYDQREFNEWLREELHSAEYERQYPSWCERWPNDPYDKIFRE